MVLEGYSWGRLTSVRPGRTSNGMTTAHNDGGIKHASAPTVHRCVWLDGWPVCEVELQERLEISVCHVKAILLLETASHSVGIWNPPRSIGRNEVRVHMAI
ncbi:uncharacterized protein STEHIDRAFT_117852 [Stereum hirsutum FP-91666 SS1]|uniref:uncharacterized protein n=1 Tax=Stereum hirsutum (strain FP-91666) TaxID=721885 RepID=UPI000440E49F|nr:uncharacterized protein STEHIDRAFT_117852 [Stereum hirsutum FP-91666 SS1]EIM92920.1 hypothetical protein STEHIDRAFT_117852 [Stereum hirsutum FP-91666 SS1]